MLIFSCTCILFEPRGTYFGKYVAFGISSSQHICLVEIFGKNTIKEMLDVLSKLEDLIFFETQMQRHTKL
jgi:hypothetical protein